MSIATSLHEKLLDIQQRLKVPKDQNNDFGGFKYRNIEDIEDKIKPLLKEHGLILVFDDEPVAVGDRIYIKATATLSDGNAEIRATAYAREAVNPKAKTDDAQLTGACSSYARKYAASGLFLIDNTKDADSDEHDSNSADSGHAPTEKQLTTIRGMLVQLGVSKEDRDEMMGHIKTFQSASKSIADLKERIQQRRLES